MEVDPFPSPVRLRSGRGDGGTAPTGPLTRPPDPSTGGLDWFRSLLQVPGQRWVRGGGLGGGSATVGGGTRSLLRTCSTPPLVSEGGSERLGGGALGRRGGRGGLESPYHHGPATWFVGVYTTLRREASVGTAGGREGIPSPGSVPCSACLTGQGVRYAGPGSPVSATHSLVETSLGGRPCLPTPRPGRWRDLTPSRADTGVLGEMCLRPRGRRGCHRGPRQGSRSGGRDGGKVPTRGRRRGRG